MITTGTGERTPAAGTTGAAGPMNTNTYGPDAGIASDNLDSTPRTRTPGARRGPHVMAPLPYRLTPEPFRRMNAYLNARRAYVDAVADGAPELRGFYMGDGVPRNASGRPYEPLDWKGITRHETR